MAEVFRTTRLVEFHDTDMAGIMHFASFFHYMESAEHEFLRSLGFSVHEKMRGEIWSYPRVAASCQYKSPAVCEEVLDVAVHISRIGTKSVTYQFEFSHEDREIATGQITSVCCVVEPGKSLTPVPVPEEIADKLRVFLA